MFLYDGGMNISLSIADYSIQISFFPTEWLEKKDLLVTLTKTYLGGFIVPKSNKYDARIQIRELSGIPFTTQHKKTYSQYFEKKQKNLYETYYHISIYELSQLLLVVLIQLLGKGGFLLHASGVITKKGVVLFMGPSGAGKSTTMNMARERYSPFSDDCVAIKKADKNYVCYQVPWVEKDSSLIKVSPEYKQISHIFTLQKDQVFSIKKLTATESLEEIIKNVWTLNGLSKNNIVPIGNFVSSKVNCSRLSLTLHDKEKFVRIM